MRKFVIAGLLAAAAVPVLAQATAPVAPPAPVAPVARIAPMADKMMTRAELDARVREHFTRLDANRDGFVTTAEADAGKAAMKDRWQQAGIGHAMNAKRRDPNAAFDRIDADRNGAISRDEFAKAREMRVEKRMTRSHDGAGRPGAKRMRMHRVSGGMVGGHLFNMADADKDGRVSLAEATTGAARHFDMMDGNRDGRITPEERRGKMRQMRSPAS